MIFNVKLGRAAATLAGCLALLSLPAFAVINQTVEFPDAQSIQGATLSLDGTDEVIEGEVREEDDRKIVVFVLPDDYDGRAATANVIVDNVPRSYPITIGTSTPTFRTGDSRSSSRLPSGSFYYGIGAGIGSLSSDFASAIGQQSALDANGLLSGQGLTNIVSSVAADDSASAWDAIIEVGYWFPDDSRLSLDFRTGSVDNFGINVDVRGDVPMSTSVISAESIATAGLDMWSANLNYRRFFTPTSNWGFLLTLGNHSVDRPTSFVSTLRLDGMPVDSFTGGEELDENIVQYGIGLEWTQRQARTWVPTVGLRLSQTGDIEIFDDENSKQVQLYFTFNRRLDGQR